MCLTGVKWVESGCSETIEALQLVRCARMERDASSQPSCMSSKACVLRCPVHHPVYMCPCLMRLLRYADRLDERLDWEALKVRLWMGRVVGFGRREGSDTTLT